MNLLIVGRKSKTQMRNMFYWAGIISILICLPLRVSAQSYEQMWKQVEVLEQKQLPKSAIQELRKIYEYAKQEKNVSQMMKAHLTRASLCIDITPDSLDSELSALKAWMEEEKDSAKLEQRFRETYLADPQKANLCRRVAQREKVLLESRPFEKEYSLYIGIPFCPTTCLYCSFTSFPVSRFGDRMRAYLDALYKELAFVAKHHRDKKLTTIYIGGGTPTALDEECLSKLMNMIHELFPVEESEEFTVESGRPDSITKEKFRILKEAGVTRISINPQTMHQETLDLIGRAHTVEQTKEAFLLARECGFDNINMDIITGLPGESLSYVHETLDEIFKLRPESLTVHSLAIKRAAHLNIEMEKYQGMVKGSTNEMLRLVDEYASNMEMEAYYMYRQKNIPGNLENIGYCVPDKECLYNILIMEEKQDIISCGAGASSKYVFEQGRIERTENVKNLDHYINRIDEMIDRKRKYL